MPDRKYEFPESQIQTSAEVVADSITSDGHRLTTMVCTFHRFVLAEFNTHRMFSRSSASSRAIPVEKQLAKVAEHPAWPLEWPAEQSGMQGGAFLEDVLLDDARDLFDDVHSFTIERVNDYLNLHPDKSERLHKSLINRLLEPFLWHTVIVTSTEWDNYFRQRVSKLAQPEIRTVAEMMLDVYDASEPRPVLPGEYHLPFVQDEERDAIPTEELVGFSVARSARVSYLNHEGVVDIDADRKLYERLEDPGDGPAHAAPLEHVASPDPGNVIRVGLVEGRVHALGPESMDDLLPEDTKVFTVPLLGNFVGWTQVRHQRLGF